MSITCQLDSNLILFHYKLDLLTRFVEIKSVNPKPHQKLTKKTNDFKYKPR